MKKEDLLKVLKKEQKENLALSTELRTIRQRMNEIVSDNLLLTSKLKACEADKDALQAEIKNQNMQLNIYKEANDKLFEKVGVRIQNATNVHIAGGHIASGHNAEVEIKN